MTLKLIEFTPGEASALSYLVRHPNSRDSKEVLNSLTGHAYYVGRIFVIGNSVDDLPGHVSIADSYKNWRSQLKVPYNTRAKLRMDVALSESGLE